MHTGSLVGVTARRLRAQLPGMGLPDRACVELLQWACPRLGLRWDGFRNVRGQVCKRIGRRMAELGVEDAAGYRKRLERDPSEWIHLDAACRVTISRFYRDHAVYDALGTTWLPRLTTLAADAGRTVRLWSVGCASGEEPYTVAMMLRFEVAPRAPPFRYEILATDADPTVLARAERGCYPGGTLVELPPLWRGDAFEPTSDRDTWCLKPALREGVRFVQQDVRREQPDGPFDVILCRNMVFTYVARDAQLPLLRAFAERLSPSGILVIGAHERLPGGADAFVEPTDHLPIFVRTSRAGTSSEGRTTAPIE